MLMLNFGLPVAVPATHPDPDRSSGLAPGAGQHGVLALARRRPGGLPTQAVPVGATATVRPEATQAAPGSPVAAPTPGEAPIGTPAAENGDQQLTMIGGEDDPLTLDPALASDTVTMFVVRQLFSGLVRFDDNLNVVPDLAATLPAFRTTARPTPLPCARCALARRPRGDGRRRGLFAGAGDRPGPGRATAGSSLPAALYLSDIAGVADKLAGQAPTVSGITASDT